MEAISRRVWRNLLPVVLIAALISPGVGLTETPAAGAVPRRSADGRGADFNGDGFADLAVSSQEDRIERGQIQSASWVVHVIYGGQVGLWAHSNQYWRESDFEAIDNGAFLTEVVLTVGDFDGDGFSDLAVEGARTESGLAVRIIFGSPRGLARSRSQLWTPERAGFGTADLAFVNGPMVAANFGRGPQDDLVIGSPFSGAGVGVVAVLYGTKDGLSATGSQLWSQDSPGVKGKGEGRYTDDGGVEGDRFGLALTAGRFSGGPYSDLAIGVPQEALGATAGAGAVNVLRGSPTGLTARGDQFWTLETPGIAGSVEADAEFGAVLAAGDFDADGRDDLAIGTPRKTVRGVEWAGSVTVLYGSARGLAARRSQVWSQASPGVPGTGEYLESMGEALAVGQFGKDANRRFADLVVSVPSESLGRRERSGVVIVLYGSRRGLTAQSAEMWSQDTAGVKGHSEKYDRFGSTLAAGDFGRSRGDGSYSDVAIAVSGEHTASGGDGAVSIIYGSSSGLVAAGDQLWDSVALGRAGAGTVPVRISGFGAVLCS